MLKRYLLLLPPLYAADVAFLLAVVVDAHKEDLIIFTIYEFTIYDWGCAVSIK